MDTAAYLKSHGWRGIGHSLDHTGRGITRPLPINRKQDLLGIGKPKTLVADQWWMRAFDSSLKDFGTGNKSALHQVRESGISRGGLYGFFVKGESLAGSIGLDISDSVSEISSDNSLSASIFTPTNATVSDTSPSTSGGEDSASFSTKISDMAQLSYISRGKKRKAEGKEDHSEIRKRRKEEMAVIAKTNVALKSDRSLDESKVAGEDGVTAFKTDKLKPIATDGTSDTAASVPEPAEANDGHDGIHPDRLARMQGTQVNGANKPVGFMKAKREARKEQNRIFNEEKKARRAAKDQKLEMQRAAKKERRLNKAENLRQTMRTQAESKKEKLQQQRAGQTEHVPQSGSGKEAPTCHETHMIVSDINSAQQEPHDTSTTANGQSTDKKKKDNKKGKKQSEPKDPETTVSNGVKDEEPEPKAKAKKEKLAKSDLDTGGSNVPARRPGDSNLSDEKRQKYAARAAEKGMTIEAYVARRVEKKDKKRSGSK